MFEPYQTKVISLILLAGNTK